ncbi:ADP-ribosylglycohydrolase family protein [Micromonospora sp. NPDC005163]
MAATVPLDAIQRPGCRGSPRGGMPYEFQLPLAVGEQPVMRGGGLGPYAPGEYSDDTQMAVCIAEVSATGADLRTSDSLDRIAGNFLRWRREGASDIGVQTRQVLDAVSHLSGAGIAAAMRDAAAELHRRTGRSAGNGSLMRNRAGCAGLSRRAGGARRGRPGGQ